MEFLKTINYLFKINHYGFYINFGNKKELQLFLSLCQTYNVRWISGAMALEKLEWAWEVISRGCVINIRQRNNNEIKISISAEVKNTVDFKYIYKLSSIANVPSSLKIIY